MFDDKEYKAFTEGIVDLLAEQIAKSTTISRNKKLAVSITQKVRKISESYPEFTSVVLDEAENIEIEKLEALDSCLSSVRYQFETLTEGKKNG